MTRTKSDKAKKDARKEATETFALYVFFHSIWTSIFNFFEN